MGISGWALVSRLDVSGSQCDLAPRGDNSTETRGDWKLGGKDGTFPDVETGNVSSPHFNDYYCAGTTLIFAIIPPSS